MFWEGTNKAEKRAWSIGKGSDEKLTKWCEA